MTRRCIIRDSKDDGHFPSVLGEGSAGVAPSGRTVTLPGGRFHFTGEETGLPSWGS